MQSKGFSSWFLYRKKNLIWSFTFSRWNSIEDTIVATSMKTKVWSTDTKKLFTGNLNCTKNKSKIAFKILIRPICRCTEEELNNPDSWVVLRLLLLCFMCLQLHSMAKGVSVRVDPAVLYGRNHSMRFATTI